MLLEKLISKLEMVARTPVTLVTKYQVKGASMARPGEQPQETNLSPLPEEQAVATVASVEEVKKKPKLATLACPNWCAD